ncbi:alpha-1,3/1,6-mannosyltransferase ALG2-like [Stylophora pistillata]|uniref:Alpha-1,3/1,6-mannosyltransferase ALG2 n=1 Tax=Stylophora pistillata TaxID=50429 RepID=A0A2B4RN19_STYPI|nr:alpha-1,3/1,6-mannosyltransferase ALG2-like [Stylophora pistillata]PFX17737.1 Alpha-1,3/1,6-mannosyltransferase ALG2 [Stylophora pistillata]
MVRVAFVHPDLGIGGAERLVVDAGLALKSRGHEVHFFTSHHDTSHCFEETKNGTLQVTAVGDWLPRHFFGYFYAFWAYLRMIYVSIYLVFFSSWRMDVVFCDQVSVCIPFLKLSKARIVFYCHFPDLLLTQRKSFLKKLYRAPLDWLEELTTGMADTVLVNSNFTAETFLSTFTSLGSNRPCVLYPSLNFSSFEKPVEKDEIQDLIPPTAKCVFLSINRYERKKNLNLALEALDWLRNIISDEEWKDVHLVMAGGYDDRVTENKEHHFELCKLAKQYNLNSKVTFVRSISDAQKLSLLNRCSCLIYTPSNEHFGIVPIEAMYMKRPVIAVNSGGPLETVQNGVTGFLCNPDAESFALVMKEFLKNPSLSSTMGEAGKENVIKKFSFDVFAQHLHSIVTDGGQTGTVWSTAVTCFLMFVVFSVACVWVVNFHNSH